MCVEYCFTYMYIHVARSVVLVYSVATRCYVHMYLGLPLMKLWLQIQSADTYNMCLFVHLLGLVHFHFNCWKCISISVIWWRSSAFVGRQIIDIYYGTCTWLFYCLGISRVYVYMYISDWCVVDYRTRKSRHVHTCIHVQLLLFLCTLVMYACTGV